MSELGRVARKLFADDFGREPLAMGIVDGIVWATVKSPAVGINGYAMIPAEGHPWSAGFPDDADLDEFLDVHGGVTWAQFPWVGFDTAHYMDAWGPEYDLLGLSRKWGPERPVIEWTPGMVATEAKNLAAQVAALGRGRNER